MMKRLDEDSAKQIKSLLTQCRLARKVICYEETGSTNDDCRDMMQGDNKSILVTAKTQNAGKGRRGRKWESPKDSSISFSLGLKPELDPSSAPMLTTVMALAVAKAIADTTGLKPLIKWPNDVVINGKKVCGILTEMNMDGGSIASVVIGVGINVSKMQLPKELEDKATSLEAEMEMENKEAAALSKPALIAGCVSCFEKLCNMVEEAKDLSPVKEEYEKFLVNMGRTVMVLDPAGNYSGTATGITETGELIVLRQDGTVSYVYAGEVSVRGIYGYA